MAQYVTDTHALLWHLLRDQRLSATARAIFNDADAGLHQILIPSIVLVETIYLAERKRVDPAALNQLLALLDMTPTNYVMVSLDFGVARTLLSINRASVPDMPDRIIAATARHLGLALLTRDSAIAASGVSVVW